MPFDIYINTFIVSDYVASFYVRKTIIYIVASKLSDICNLSRNPQICRDPCIQA